MAGVLRPATVIVVRHQVDEVEGSLGSRHVRVFDKAGARPGHNGEERGVLPTLLGRMLVQVPSHRAEQPREVFHVFGTVHVVLPLLARIFPVNVEPIEVVFIQQADRGPGEAGPRLLGQSGVREIIGPLPSPD